MTQELHFPIMNKLRKQLFDTHIKYWSFSKWLDFSPVYMSLLNLYGAMSKTNKKFWVGAVLETVLLHTIQARSRRFNCYYSKPYKYSQKVTYK